MILWVLSNPHGGFAQYICELFWLWVPCTLLLSVSLDPLGSVSFLGLRLWLWFPSSGGSFFVQHFCSNARPVSSLMWIAYLWGIISASAWGSMNGYAQSFEYGLHRSAKLWTEYDHGLTLFHCRFLVNMESWVFLDEFYPISVDRSKAAEIPNYSENLIFSQISAKIFARIF